MAFRLLLWALITMEPRCWESHGFGQVVLHVILACRLKAANNHVDKPTFRWVRSRFGCKAPSQIAQGQRARESTSF